MYMNMSSSISSRRLINKRWASASLNSAASTVLEETSTAAAVLEIRTIATGLFFIPDTNTGTIPIQVEDILRRSEAGEEG